MCIRDRDYIVDEKARTATLTQSGVKKAERYFNIANLTDAENLTLSHHINLSLIHIYSPAQERIWPSPVPISLIEVRSESPIGPLAWSFCVEMPISAPRPNSPPSVKRVDALT